MTNSKREEFYRPVLRLTIPIILQNLLSAAVGSADVIMLSRVSQSSVAAESLASQYTHILLMFFYGLGTGITMLGAQYWGKKDIHAIEIIEGIALRISLAIALIAAGCAVCIPQLLMKVFTNDPELISLGVSYLRLVSISYICWAVGEVFLSGLRSVERVGVSTALNAMALAINVILNAVFIFGLLGAPRLGVAGVALATSIARFVQMIACFIVSAGSRDVKLRLSYMFQSNKVLQQDFVKMSVPAIINDISWGIAFSLYSAILGHLSSDMVAANSIVSVTRTFATTACFAFGTATMIWIGKKIGQNDFEAAKRDARRFMKLTVISGALGGLLIFLASPLILKNVSLNENALRYLRYMLYINTYYVMGTAVNTTLICGVFRAGGNTRFGMICDIIDMWVYALPLGFLSAFVFKLPHMVVYFLLCTDEFVKWPWVLSYYHSNKWVTNITKQYE